MINDQQVKILEVLAAAALTVASIFFTALTLFLGSMLSLGAQSKRRPLRLGLVATHVAMVVSLALTVAALTALRFRTEFLYGLTIVLTALTFAGVVIVGSLMLHRGLSEIRNP